MTKNFLYLSSIKRMWELLVTLRARVPVRPFILVMLCRPEASQLKCPLYTSRLWPDDDINSKKLSYSA